MPDQLAGYDNTMEPEWFFHKGMKMSARRDKAASALHFDASAAHLTITPIPERKGRWKIDWNVQHFFDTKTSGTLSMDTNTLRASFGCKAFAPSRTHIRITRKLKADYMMPGSFVRKGRFLCVPDPGTGIAFAATVYIYMTDDMIKLTNEFIKDELHKQRSGQGSIN